MTVDIVLCEKEPSKDDLDGILAEYYDRIVHRMRSMGLDIALSAPQSALREFWRNVGD